MDKFVIRDKRASSSSVGSSIIPIESQDGDEIVGASCGKRARMEPICEEDIISDPALRKPIIDYEPQVRDGVRWEYVIKGPCQPFSYDFPRRDFGNKTRCFQVEWFKKWEWLEYSVFADAAFCFWCYLFRGETSKRFGNEVFVKTGFRNWKKASEKFREHVGAAGSSHNEARTLFFAFKDQRQSLTRSVSSGKRALDVACLTRLTASVDVARFLLGQGLDFCGHDESACLLNRGNFLELLDLYSSHNLDVGKLMMENAHGNNQFTCPRIQKEIISACATETTKAIISDIGDKFFSLLIEETCDTSVKEQMVVGLRYVNNYGVVLERFLGVVNVVDFTALSLKSGIDEFFAKHGLSISKLRGQGIGEACNLRDELNGLKNLILNENSCARYIHRFAYQFQLVIVAVSQKNQYVSDFFEYLSMITNMVGASCKRIDESGSKQHENMVHRLEKGELSVVQGSNQETTLVRSEATRWGSHYITVVRLLSLWSSAIQVLENIFDDGTEIGTRGFAASLVEKMESYQFVFAAHLMNQVLGLTNVLSQFLQQKDQNLLEVVSLVESTKRKLQDLRENGWDELLGDVNNFCCRNDIIILNMEDNAPSRFGSRRVGHAITYYQHFRVEIFCQVIDQIVEEMENRFGDSNAELLTCIACLDPKNSFSNFNESKLLRLVELYPQDFSICDQMELKDQLKMWIYEMRGNENFSKLQDIGAVAKKMVEVGIHTAFHLVYRLIELVLVLPIVSATVERVFSRMNFTRTDLLKKMGDDFLTDRLVCYIENDVFRSIHNEVIIRHFQHRTTREMDLALLPFDELKEIP